MFRFLVCFADRLNPYIHSRQKTLRGCLIFLQKTKNSEISPASNPRLYWNLRQGKPRLVSVALIP
jgi:hypothetical protein